MTLSEFITKRLNDLGMRRSDLVNNHDLAWSTLSNIDRGKPVNKVSWEKLAKALQCSQGDIQKCMAEQNPLRDVVVNKKSLAKMKPKPEAPAPDPEEEPAAVFQPEEPTDVLFPAHSSPYDADRQEGEEQFKHKLREMCLRIFSSGVPGVHTMEKIYADIGYALVKELVNSDEAE